MTLPVSVPLCGPLCMSNFPSACCGRRWRNSAWRAQASLWAPHSAGRSPYTRGRTPVACVIIHEALSPEEHTKERTLFYEAAIHRVFPRDSWVKFLRAYLIFKFFSSPFLSASVVCKPVSIHFPCFVHGRCPLKGVSHVSLYSCFVGSYSVFS